MIERHKRKIKFSMVSLIATAIDFATLLILTSNGVSTVVANYPSTTAGFIFSFFANKKFTFRTPDRHIRREAILFVAITLFSNWAIQPFLIWLVERLLESAELQDWQSVVAAKLVASTVTFVWNYYFCTRLVFKKKTDV